MSTAEALEIVSKVSYGLGGVLLVLAVILWIKFRIPEVIGDLSGRTAKRSIERMRKNNEQTGNKLHRPSQVNLERGKKTELMQKEAKKIARAAAKTAPQPKSATRGTLPLSVQKAEGTIPLSVCETDLLDMKKTELLLERGTEPLLPNETEVLQTMPLSITEEITDGQPIEFTMLDDVTMVHTDETI